jgi:hypothetical protein
VAVCVIATPPAVAETVLDPVTVEVNEPVATPLALVGAAGWASVFPDPLAARATVAPLTGLPNASFAVTVIVDVPLPARMDVGLALTVDCAADGGPAVTVTVAVWVIETPLMVAETVFVPAAVDDSVPVATPLAPVVPDGWAIVLPLPVADSTTLAPLTGLPLASRAVTVMRDVVPPLDAAMLVGDAPTLDWDADTPSPGSPPPDALMQATLPVSV